MNIKKEKYEYINELKHKVVSTYYDKKLIKEEWFLNNNKHRENDLPAVIYANGTRKWYFYDLLHRENKKPAIETKEENKFFILGYEIHPYQLEDLYYSKKEYNKDNLNFIEYNDNLGNSYTKVNSLLNSIKDNPSMTIMNYEQRWYKNGFLDRLNDLPAIINELEKQWFSMGKYHRELSKPAYMSAEEGNEYWFDGVHYTLDDVKKYFIKQKIEDF